jgi:hypothetical protein
MGALLGKSPRCPACGHPSSPAAGQSSPVGPPPRAPPCQRWPAQSGPWRGQLPRTSPNRLRKTKRSSSVSNTAFPPSPRAIT